jgi:DNA-binding GntR family transcriptional regulator
VHEGQLADSMGVSKTPIREALGQLVQEGYVEVRPRQGYRVTDVTLADIHEVFAIRRMLEPAAAELAAEHATAEQLQELQELAQTRYIVGDSDTYEAFIAEDRTFHVRVAEASGNGRLAAALRGLLEETQRLFFLGLDLRDTADEQVREREALVEALLRGNHHVARDVAERQVESSRKRVMQALLGSVRPAVTRATQPARDASDPVASDPVASDPVT